MYIKEYLIAKFADQSPGDYWYYDGIKANQTIADITNANFFNGANLKSGDLLKADMTDGSLLVNVNIVNNAIVIQQITANKEILEYDTLAEFPAIGEVGNVYIALDTGNQYIWNQNTNTYTQLSVASTAWGTITGPLSRQTDLQNILDLKQNKLTIDTTLRTASFGVSVYNKIYLVDTPSVAIVVSLLGSPVEGDQVAFISQNDTSTKQIQIVGQIPEVEVANIKNTVKQYLALTYYQSKWVITTQTMVDANGIVKLNTPVLTSPQLTGLPVATNLTQKIDKYNNSGFAVNLTTSSAHTQIFTGTLAPVEVTLPNTTGLPDGFGYVIENQTNITVPIVLDDTPRVFELPGNSSAVVQYDLETTQWLVATNYTKINSVTVNSDYSLTNADDYIIIDSSAGPVTVTLPLTTTASLDTGTTWTFLKKDSSTNVITIQSQSPDIILGGNTANSITLESVKGSVLYLFTNYQDNTFYKV